jgi:glycosyltransferase involved in cell wall biosynthesis
LSSERRRRPIDAVLSAATFSWYLVADRARLRCARARVGAQRGDRVSIPIATYDRIDILLGRTIPTLLKQTHKDIEIIVVGDGTPAPLWEAVESFRDPRVRVKRLRRRTRYPADPLSLWMVAGWRPRNLGARMATGDWILWISDDDILPERAIESLLAVARRSPDVDLVSGEQQTGTMAPHRVTLANTDHGLPFKVVGMPLLCRSTLSAFRWNRHSWRKRWNRPCDFDLLERMGRRGVRMDVTEELVVIHPEVSGTGSVGSRGAIQEELRRRERDASA